MQRKKILTSFLYLSFPEKLSTSFWIVQFTLLVAFPEEQLKELREAEVIALKFKRSLLRGKVRNFYFGGGWVGGGRGKGYIVGRGGGSHNFEVKLKLHNSLIRFSKYTTLRFLVFPFFMFQVLQMLLLFQYCTSNILINIIISNLM